MTATISAQGDPAGVLVGAKRVGGYRLALADWHQAKAIGLMFLDRVTSVLPTVTEPATPAASRSGVDDLASLTDLRDRGLLTEEEFAVATKKLLS